ncbi:MAG TPA: exo-alpha-sialidase [Terriglobales bacterium]|nr:exo-alpha-sialidase [Terriglobales bacterium]
MRYCSLLRHFWLVLIVASLLNASNVQEVTEKPRFKVEIAPWLTILHSADNKEISLSKAAVSSGFPLVVGPNRILMLFRGPKLNEVQVAISTDGARSWSPRGVIDKNPEPGITVGRPVAVKSRHGSLWVFYTGSLSDDAECPKAGLWVIQSDDGGKSWAERKRIWTGDAANLQGAVETRSGTIVLPFGYLVSPNRFANGVILSRDRGKTWKLVPSVVDIPLAADRARREHGVAGGALEAAIVQLKDGRLWILARTITGNLWQSFSKDDGETWAPASPSLLTCGGSVHLTRLASGRLALVWNQADWSNDPFWHYPWNLREVSLAFSEDDGKTWDKPMVFARGESELHSLVTEVSPGVLLLTLPQDGLLLEGREGSIRTAQEWARFDSPFIFRKYSSRPTAPQVWAQLYRYGHMNKEEAGAESPRVVFIGDSITDYWSLDKFFPGRGYINRGISGQTTPQMMLRFFPDVIALKPDVVVILGGTNDVARDPGPHVPVQMMEDSVRAMVELAHKHHIRVVLCTIPPVSDYNGFSRTKDRPAAAIKLWNSWLRKYAAEVQAGLADYFSVMADENQLLRADYSIDGVHPNDIGYAAMAPAVQSAIERSTQHGPVGSRQP